MSLVLSNSLFGKISNLQVYWNNSAVNIHVPFTYISNQQVFSVKNEVVSILLSVAGHVLSGCSVKVSQVTRYDCIKAGFPPTKKQTGRMCLEKSWLQGIGLCPRGQDGGRGWLSESGIPRAGWTFSGMGGSCQKPMELFFRKTLMPCKYSLAYLDCLL